MNPALLPPNATMLEKALSCAMDVPPRLYAGTDAMASYKSLPPDAVVPFLIWEYGLGALQPYIKNQRELIRQGLIWQRLRGTPAAITMALGFMGLSATIEEDGKGKHWATFQLGVVQTLNPEQIEHIVTLVNLSKPARCRLWRMYTDIFDRRPIILSDGPILGDGWLSYYSGVPVETPGGEDGDEIIVSFGSKHSVQADAYADFEMQGSFGATLGWAFLAPYLDSFTVGRSRLGMSYPRNNPFVIGSLFSILWADRQTTPRKWRGEWDARCWLDYTGFDRKLPRWRMERRAVSRSQLVPSWSDGLSDNNSRLGVIRAVVIDKPGRLGAMRLGHNPERRELRLHEMTLVPRGLTVFPVDPQTPQTAGTVWLTASGEVRNPKRVRQAMHSEQSLTAMPAVQKFPEIATLLSQAARSVPLEPGEPSAALTSFLAPIWLGAWTRAGRTWKTSLKLSIQ